MRTLLTTAVMLAAAVVNGCASSPQASFYTLSVERPQEPAGDGMPAAIPSWAIVMGAVTVPEIDDRPQFVRRVDVNRITLDEFSRWAEPLKSQVRRVIAADLAVQFPGALVSAYPQNVDPALTYVVSIDVESFESAPEAASVSVLWSVKPPKEGKAVSGRSVVSEPTGAQGNDALVAAHSRAMATVSNAIAAAIRSTRRP
ncbi:hypothetical protein SAMN05414139_02073 [Burkholderia sp. D7]|nr:hypothetical protein SAMN05414139_02073 [Burkholderia sp. D7]